MLYLIFRLCNILLQKLQTHSAPTMVNLPLVRLRSREDSGLMEDKHIIKHIVGTILRTQPRTYIIFSIFTEQN